MPRSKMTLSTKVRIRQEIKYVLDKTKQHVQLFDGKILSYFRSLAITLRVTLRVTLLSHAKDFWGRKALFVSRGLESS